MYLDGVMEEVKIGMGRMQARFLKEERLHGLLYANDLVLYSD